MPPALDPVELLERALTIPSVSGSEREVAEFLVERMASFADEALVDGAGNAVGRVGDGPLRVMFLGHIDTVAGEVPVRTVEGKLYGRGAVDAKGPFCAAVAAASRLPEWARRQITLTLVGATEEETPTSKGARFILEDHEPPDLLVIGEPSGWDALTLGYKGRLVLRAEVAKPSHHSAGKESTAAEDVVAVWIAVRHWARELNRGTQGIFEQVQVGLQQVTSGDDGLEQRATAVIGFRLPPAYPPQRVREALATLLPDGPAYEFRGAELPYRAERDTTLSRAFRIAIRQQGGRPRFKLKTGTSDMNVVAPHWQVPVLAYGPGDSKLDHTPTEHVRLDELRIAVEVLHDAWERLAASRAD